MENPDIAAFVKQNKLTQYRLRWDPARIGEDKREHQWLVELPCSNGGVIAGRTAHMYRHGPTSMGFCGVGLGLRRRLIRAGAQAWQTGDEEFSVIFPLELLPKIVKVVKPLRLRGVQITATTQKGRLGTSKGGVFDPTARPEVPGVPTQPPHLSDPVLGQKQGVL